MIKLGRVASADSAIDIHSCIGNCSLLPKRTKHFPLESERNMGVEALWLLLHFALR
jgi:hypothetical protein